MRVLKAFVAGGIVVVRAHRLGDSPVGDRKFGVEFGGALEGTRGLVVIEGIDQAQALVEELLGLDILGRNGVMKIAQTRHQCGGFGWRRMCRVLLRYYERGTENHKQDGAHLPHWQKPPN